MKVNGNQHAVMTVIRLGGIDDLRKAQRVRENFKRRLRMLRRTPAQRAKDAAYSKAYREKNAARIAERKKRWRLKNKPKVNAYMRRYDDLTPGRREYKAAKCREYRARDRVAA